MTTSPHIPDGQRIYAIGDIHGHITPLKKLLELVEADLSKHPDAKGMLVFLGDYIDRGAHSKDVIELMLHGLPKHMSAHFLRGNHEDIVLRILKGDLEATKGWLHFGGRQTLLSYGIHLPLTVAPELLESIKDKLRQEMPQEHLTFLAATELYWVTGDYCFVHAGIRPEVAIHEQLRDDFLWIRKDFLGSDADHGKIIVHGHTITEKPDFHSNRIGIDTGAYASGHLTCLVLHGTQRQILQT